MMRAGSGRIPTAFPSECAALLETSPELQGSLHLLIFIILAGHDVGLLVVQGDEKVEVECEDGSTTFCLGFLAFAPLGRGTKPGVEYLGARVYLGG